MQCLYSTFQIYTICQRENEKPDFQERAFMITFAEKLRYDITPYTEDSLVQYD